MEGVKRLSNDPDTIYVVVKKNNSPLKNDYFPLLLISDDSLMGINTKVSKLEGFRTRYPLHVPPLQQDPFLSFLHTFSPKRVCVRGQRPPPPTGRHHPNGKSWIHHCLETGNNSGGSREFQKGGNRVYIRFPTVPFQCWKKLNNYTNRPLI